MLTLKFLGACCTPLQSQRIQYLVVKQPAAIQTEYQCFAKPQQKYANCCIGIMPRILIGVIKWEELVEYNEGN